MTAESTTAGGSAATAQRIAGEIRAALVDSGRRLIVGFAGAPGSGKSTLATLVCAELGPRAVLVPLDGWHLSAHLTARLGLTDRRGAPETFDAVGFLALLRRLREQGRVGGPPVFAPEYRREIEEPVSGAVAVEAHVPVVVTEGNYLLLDRPVWRDVRAQLDIAYLVHLDPEERRRRLVARHRQFGKSADEAARWVAGSDEANARLVAEESLAPHRVVTLG